MQDSEEEDEPCTVPCWVDMDCTVHCSSCQHASQLIAAVTKATSWQSVLFLSRCHNFGIVSDELGRTVLHVAASCGCPLAVLKLLAKHSDLTAQDAESGWTALHRSLFYGQLSVARFLISVCWLYHYFTRLCMWEEFLANSGFCVFLTCTCMCISQPYGFSWNLKCNISWFLFPIFTKLITTYRPRVPLLWCPGVVWHPVSPLGGTQFFSLTLSIIYLWKFSRYFYTAL